MFSPSTSRDFVLVSRQSKYSLMPMFLCLSFLIVIGVFSQMQDDFNLRPPPRNKESAKKNILLLISYT